MPYPIASIGDDLVYLTSQGVLRPAVSATDAVAPDQAIQLMVLDPTATELGYTIHVAPFNATRSANETWSWPSGTAPGVVQVSNFPAVQAVSGVISTTGTVAVSNLPATQPVSGAVAVSNLPSVQAVSGAVEVSNLPATQPVSGTIGVNNFPATQPVSGTIAVGNFPATQPVTGTFFQATQPVSGTIAVNNFPATQPVSGTFFQATQPVSGSVSVSNLPATQAVSGTVGVNNFPASQTVNGTVIANIGTAGALALDATLTGGNQKTQLVDGSGHALNIAPSGTIGVTGTFFQATQPVSGTIGVNNFPATQPVSGTIGVNNFPATQPVSGTITANIGTADGLAQDTTLTSGAQKTQIVNPTRVIRTFTAAFTAATTEALVTLTPNTDGTPGATGTSFTVTSGKRLRLSALMLTCFNATAAIHACQVNLRMSATGAVTTASPAIATVATTTAAATANLTSSQAQALPDGIELSGTMQVGISQIGVALAGQTVVLVGYEY